MTPEDIKYLPFFWSVRRKRYWNQCRLRYFLHYYMARLGRYEDADDDCREAYALDRRVAADAFVRIMLCKTMYEMFRSGETGSVAVESVLRFRREVNRMLSFPDDVPQIVAEIADGVIPVAYTADYIAGKLKEAGKKVDQNFWNKIQYVPMEFRKNVDHPQQVRFMELSCYFVPVVVFSVHGEIWILESSSVKTSGDFISCLHRMWVSNELGRDPTRVRSLYFDENFELKQLDDLPSASAFLNAIKKDIHDMMEAEMEGFVTLRDFPPTPGSGCRTCQFKNFCIQHGTLSCNS